MRILSAASLAGLLLLGGCEFLVKQHARQGRPRTAPQVASKAAPQPERKAVAQPAHKPVPQEAGKAAPQAAEPRDLSLGIPSDQLPAPGQCRVWMPDTPSGQQEAPGPCAAVQKKVPGGAWVLFRSQQASNVIAVNVYRSKWPRTVAETRYFDYWTGRLLRVE